MICDLQQQIFSAEAQQRTAYGLQQRVLLIDIIGKIFYLLIHFDRIKSVVTIALIVQRKNIFVCGAKCLQALVIIIFIFFFNAIFPRYDMDKLIAENQTGIQQRIDDIAKNVVVVEQQKKSYHELIALFDYLRNIFGSILLGH